MQPSQHILVIRFSAMGDVAMTVPVIKSVLQQNPNLQITVVSNAFLQPLFQDIERCNFYAAHLKTKHNGVRGLYSLYKELISCNKFDAVIDLHNVLRSKILRLFFKFSFSPAYSLDKGRSEKKLLTRKENKILSPLKSMHERYADVFRKYALKLDLNFSFEKINKIELPSQMKHFFSSDKKILAIAPFAQYEEKMYPLQRMKNVVSEISKQNNIQILLFGGGKKEIEELQQWENEMSFVYCVAGKYSFAEELAIMSNVDVMVSMDSANMHLASLYNVPVVSIWGSTHHFAGFYGWKQDVKNIVEVDLFCRPCSVFGNKPCYRKDRACLEMISKEMILQKINRILNLNK